jgi:hypothetical protein
MRRCTRCTKEFRQDVFGGLCEDCWVDGVSRCPGVLPDRTANVRDRAAMTVFDKANNRNAKIIKEF